MKRHLFTLGVVALVALLATSAFAANRGVQFKAIGFIHPWDPGPYPATTVWDMTDDGSILLTSPSWSGGYATLTTFPGLEWTLVGGIYSGMKLSGDGTALMAGIPYFYGPGSWDYYSRTAIWNGTENDWTMIPQPEGFEPCGSSGLSFYDMAGNAEYATGLTWEGCSLATAYRWDAATNTTVNLGSPNDEPTRGNAITDDGNTIAGWHELLCGTRRGARWDEGVWSHIDGQGLVEAKVCETSSGGCCSDWDCPEHVDDAYCDRATCDAGFCVGGPNAGQACTSNWNCEGYCIGGPNDGDTCTGDWYCPDTPTCVANPAWTPEQFKGEAFVMTPDGSYIAGRQYGESPYPWDHPLYDPYLWVSGYRQNPDGSFIQLWPPEGVWPDGSWDPYEISDDGSVIVGTFGSFWSIMPVLWTEETGTLDFQLFLLGQGLDDVNYWYIERLTTVSGDGTKVAGFGTNYINPDCASPWGCLDGFVVDISKVSVCHKGQFDPDTGQLTKGRTLTIAWDSIGDHLAHGDDLATCEYMETYGGLRSADVQMRPVGPNPAPDADSRAQTAGQQQGGSFHPVMQGESADPAADSRQQPAPSRRGRFERRR